MEGTSKHRIQTVISLTKVYFHLRLAYAHIVKLFCLPSLYLLTTLLNQPPGTATETGLQEMASFAL